VKVGDLYRFRIRAPPRVDGRPGKRPTLDGRIAVYLGEAFIHRDDGVTIENHQVLMVGESSPSIIDRGLLKWMNKVTE
jgi:hypothetical protein